MEPLKPLIYQSLLARMCDFLFPECSQEPAQENPKAPLTERFRHFRLTHCNRVILVISFFKASKTALYQV
ncbi:hypothetical protein, partial [Staphylococcus aureus]|uniref:hypothetical protein n=1 Tax=Staphylococcus aureus TaxID=1280 RepID=UPI00301D259B